jgi:tRNA (guanine-N7-)-methyltransferase
MVDNPERIAQYRALMTERRAELRATLDRIAPPGSRVTWEVGCGHGHFLTAYAQAHPESLCVGIDIVPERIERAIRKRDRAGLVNLHFVLAEAHLFLEQLSDAVTFAEVFVLFPDPWPKARHHKHRLMQSRFLSAVAGRAGVGTRLCFRTDFAPYYSEAAGTVRDHPEWLITTEDWPFEFETVFQSRAASHQSLVARRRPAPAISEPM